MDLREANRMLAVRMSFRALDDAAQKWSWGAWYYIAIVTPKDAGVCYSALYA
jgi:hypothetical protein